MAKRRVRRHRRGPSVRGITVKRRNNPGMALSPKVLLGIGVLVIGGAAAYYFLSKSKGGGSSSPSGTDAYGNPVDSHGNAAEQPQQPQLPSEQPTATTPEIVIPANVTPVATPGGAPPKQVTLGPSITQPSSTPLTANERSQAALDARTPANSPARPNFTGAMPQAEYDRFEKLSSADQQIYRRLMTPAQNDAYWARRSEVMKAQVAAAAASGTANYEREAGAALMPVAIYAYYGTRANFDKNLEGYRGSLFYDLLGSLNYYLKKDSAKAPLLKQTNSSAEAKAYRLSLSKEAATRLASGKEKPLFEDFKRNWNKG